MKIFITLLFSLLLASCPEKQHENIAKHKDQDVLFTLLYSGNLSGTGEVESQNIVITSKDEWSNILSKLDVEAMVVADVDFENETVLILVDSIRNTGGFTIGVEKIVETQEQLEVVVKHTGPKPTDMVTMAITQPFEVIKIKRTRKNIVFK